MAGLPKSLRPVNRFLRHPSAATGLAIVACVVAVVAAAPRLAPLDPLRVQVGPPLRPPDRRHPLGTDNLGRDMLARVLYGGRISLGYSSAATALAAVCGTSIGLLAGYARGRLDRVVMRMIDLLLAFPRMLLALLLVAVLGVGLTNVTIAVTLSAIPLFARVVRGSVLLISAQDFVEAARAIGASDLRIIRRHIAANVSAQVIVLATLNLAASIFALSSLSFLGLGVQPPWPEWGALASRGRELMRDAWWVALFPGLAIALTVLGVNLLGDGLRDVLDPRIVVRP